MFIAFAVSTHSATYAVLLALGLAALVFSWLNAKLAPRRGLAHVTVAMVLGAAMLLAGNYIVAKRIAWTPGGYGIAFGRMLQDGIVTRYLNDHCPDPRLRLCPYRNELPLDADEFLWGDGVFNRLGRFAGLGDEMRTIVLGSLRDYPVMQIETALVATAKQLVAVGTGEGVVTTIWHTYGMIERYTPAVVPAMRAARQQHGEIDFEAINAVHEPVAWAAMALLPVMILLGLRSGDFADLGRLAATVALALLANAAVCGVISNPHDRYGSRMVWIAAFAVALAAWRGFVLARQRSGRLRPIAAAAPVSAACRSGAEVLRQFEPLRLIVRADAGAVKLVGTRQHFFVDQPADDLAVFEDERHFARAHFQHRARAEPAGSGIAEAGIEEAGVVHAEFADQRIERHHLGGIVGRHLHGFRRSQDIKLVGIEDQALVGARGDRLPEIGDVIGGAALDVDDGGVALGAIADDAPFPDAQKSALQRRKDRCSPRCRRPSPPRPDRPAARAHAARAAPRHRARHRRGAGAFATAACLRAPEREKSSG